MILFNFFGKKIQVIHFGHKLEIPIYKNRTELFVFLEKGEIGFVNDIAVRTCVSPFPPVVCSWFEISIWIYICSVMRKQLCLITCTSTGC